MEVSSLLRDHYSYSDKTNRLNGHCTNIYIKQLLTVNLKKKSCNLTEENCRQQIGQVNVYDNRLEIYSMYLEYIFP